MGITKSIIALFFYHGSSFAYSSWSACYSFYFGGSGFFLTVGCFSTGLLLGGTTFLFLLKRETILRIFNIKYFFIRVKKSLKITNVLLNCSIKLRINVFFTFSSLKSFKNNFKFSIVYIFLIFEHSKLLSAFPIFLIITNKQCWNNWTTALMTGCYFLSQSRRYKEKPL